MIRGEKKSLTRRISNSWKRKTNMYFFSLSLCSILGMNLFGCKFCKDIKVSHEVYLQTECSRKNFDSLLWATLTVFQVMKFIVVIKQVPHSSFCYPWDCLAMLSSISIWRKHIHTHMTFHVDTYSFFSENICPWLSLFSLLHGRIQSRFSSFSIIPL